MDKAEFLSVGNSLGLFWCVFFITLVQSLAFYDLRYELHILFLEIFNLCLNIDAVNFLLRFSFTQWILIVFLA